jgi:hypothetical protein
MFEKELKSVLKNFSLERGEALSQKIHKAEEKGYDLSAREEILWSKLTQKIESWSKKYR